jgi:glycosyltransferase WbpL
MVFLVLLGTFLFSIIFVGFVRRYAIRENIIDLPNDRSSHTIPTPRGGGVAIVVSFTSALCALSYWRLIDMRTAVLVGAAGCAIAGIGYADDRRQLSARLRFTVHIAAAIFVVSLIGGFPAAKLARWGLGEFWIGSAFTVLVLVWGTNLFNFMDGIDGIAGSEAISISAAAAWFNWHDGGDPGMTAAMLALSAASLGCLAWNWPPARIFIGDVGSGFLGFMVITLTLVASQRGTIPIEVLPILGGVFLTDATITLIRRLLRGDRWLDAHRMHAYQHLARRFGNHKAVTLTVIAINCGWLLPWAFVANRFPEYARFSVAGALVPLCIVVGLAGAGKRDR